MKHLRSKTKWYCPKCGNLNELIINSTVSNYYESNVDKQVIVKHTCRSCLQEAIIYKNISEVVQIHIRLKPENEIKEIK